MNYLAHFHLSAGDDALLVGALLGDFIKGPLPGRLPPGLERGVYLHRRIDAFTDTHPQLRQWQRQFRPEFRRYGGIMLDVLFDHFLSRHWTTFHHQPLDHFSAEVYALLQQHVQSPAAARDQAQRLVLHDVLGNYRHWPTVPAALERIHQRLQRHNPLDRAAAELEPYYAELEQTFLAFYPQLVAHCRQLRQEMGD